ncbi:MAG TPA: pyridoxal phosphate-dependent aminotransferase [Dehalococcoidales bacterium]|nr:pyridoxal phosphate-dependent aminotransferase [Dehalococcoidales bacterium]
MLKISPVLQSIPEYPFAKVGKYSRTAEQRDGIKVINARIGIPDVEAPATIKELLARFAKEKNSTYGYPVDAHPARGIPELIDAIINDYRKKYAVSLKPENVVVTAWTKEALHNLVRIFSGQGKIQIPDPVYPAYESATLLSFNRIERVRTSRASGWQPEFNFKDKETAALYFCDPNNPTGAMTDIAFHTKLGHDLKASNICGIFDKAYKDYVFDEYTKPVSITQVPGLMDYGYEVVSLSKHYNFVGIGLGWLVSSEENINHYLKISSYFSQGVEWYKQRVGVEALTNPAVKQEMAEYFTELRERRNLLVKGLNELGLKVEAPRATPYLWVEVPQGYDDEDFVLNQMIDRAHVAFMPGSYFGQGGKGYFRTTLYISKSQVEEVLSRIQKVRNW